MNRGLWELVKAFIENELAAADYFTIYSEELIARFGLNYRFFEIMPVLIKEDHVDFECQSSDYKHDTPFIGFYMVFFKKKLEE